MTFFYLFLILHILFGLLCVYLVKLPIDKAEVWFRPGDSSWWLGRLPLLLPVALAAPHQTAEVAE